MLYIKNKIKFAVFGLGIVIGLWTISFHSIANALSADDLIYMTEDYPPLNFEKDGKLQGISVDLLVTMLEKLKSKKIRNDILLLPWARAYQDVQKKPNTCLFAMTRTAEREKLFKFVGPICPSRIVLFARKDRKIKIQSIEDIKKYKIGVVRDDIGELSLVELGIQKRTLDAVPQPTFNAKKLAIGRIDLWAYGEVVAPWILKENGFNPNEYEIVYTLKEGEQYFAFHKDTPDDLIKRFQDALNEIKKRDIFQNILNKYLKN